MGAPLTRLDPANTLAATELFSGNQAEGSSVRRVSVALVVEVVLAVFAVLLAVLCWQQGVQSTAFPATGDVPAHTATRYVGPWLFGACVLVAVAGLVLLDAFARGMRSRG